MARKISHVVLISALLVSTCLTASGQPDWTSDLTSNIHRMTENINRQVQQFTEQLQTRIQHNLESSLRPALEEVNRTIQNLPRDANGQIITNSGSTIIVNSGNGVSRSILSGRTPGGESYVRDIEERQEGNFLYHNEIIYKPQTNSSETIRWKLDLATPGAKPEIITE
ncbi:uncharacterized protein [Linepithema humile]|uniref:uncharacterized protein n=1 Tax=Linepithema humile TaxID=83485 RepID=UPI00062336AE|nr:PREDICTED: uncharacterized protein LOC105672202 [Linepithema humile]